MVKSNYFKLNCITAFHITDSASYKRRTERCYTQFVTIVAFMKV